MLNLCFLLSYIFFNKLRKDNAYLNGFGVTAKFDFLASGQEKEQAKQIFTSSAASGILTNDLVKIMESEKVVFISLRQVQLELKINS